MRGVDFEINGLSVDALVVSCYPCCLGLDFTLNLGEVVESPTRNVQKLGPFVLACDAGRSVGYVDFIVVRTVFAVAGKVDEL